MEKPTGTQQSEAGMSRSYVVTGGSRGIGRAVVERLLSSANTVVVIEFDQAALAWTRDHPAGPRVKAVVGDAADEKVTDRAALNLNPAVVGCATAIRRFQATGTPGAIVNLSSYQARQAVPGCTPYVIAKAAIEGLTRALAVEYGPHGIAFNAVAPGSVVTERYEAFLSRQEPEAVARIEEEMRQLHSLGRVARSQEVAAAIVYLLAHDASCINGAPLPVAGGRAVLARDPEA